MDLLNKRRLAVICSVPVLTMILNLTNYSFLFRHAYHLDYGGPFPILHWTNGVWFWIWFVWGYAIFTLPFIFLARSFHNLSHLSIRQGYAVLSAIALPLTVNLLFQIGITPIPGLNLTSATFSISGILIILAVYRYNLFNIIPIARGSIIESMSDGILVLDTQYRVADINPAMLRILGQTSGSMVGKNIDPFFTDWPDITNHLRDGQDKQVEILVDERYFEVSISSLKNQFGRPVGRLIVTRDMTKRKEVEHKYRFLVEQMPAVVYIDSVDETDTYAYVSPQIEDLLGYPFKYWEKDPFFWQKCVHPEDHDRAVAVTPKTLVKEQVIEEYRMITQKGAVLWVRDYSTLVRDASGKALFVQGFWVDITEQKQAESRKMLLYNTLHAVGRHLDLNDIARSAVEVIRHWNHRSVVGISIPVENGRGWKSIAGTGDNVGKVHPTDRGVVGKVHRTGQTKYVPDTSANPDYFQGTVAISHSELAVPIRHQDKVLGVLNVESDKLDDFNEQDISLIESLADVVSLAMANAYQYAETQAELNERRYTENALVHIEDELQLALKNTQLLYDIAKIGISSTALPQLLQEIVERVAKDMPADRVSIFILDLPAKKIKNFVRGGSGADEIVLSVDFEELMDGLSGWAINTRQLALSPKGESDPRESEATQKRREETNCGSIIVAPLQYQESILGTLTLINRPDESDFTNRDAELIEAVADQISSSIVKVTLEDNLQKQNKWLASLHQITFDLLNKHDIDDLLQSIVEQAAQFLDAPYSEIMLLENDELVVKALTSNQPQLLGDRAGREEASLSWKAFDTQKPVTVEDYRRVPERREVYDGMGLGAAAVLPILLGNKSIGVLGIARLSIDKPFDINEIQAASLFSRLAALALDNAQLHETLRQESIRDPLTGLFNRRFMMETLANELSRSERNSTPLTVVMFDLDHLKQLNDLYGHHIGDEALHRVGKLLMTNIRIGDTACRYGGDEFTLILSNTTGTSAKQRMEELQKEMKKTIIQNGEDIIRLTLSIGVSEYPTHGSTGQELIKAADKALYHAKQAGRNQIKTA